MTTVKQLREYLAGLPDNMEVSVLKEDVRGYMVGTHFVPLELPENHGAYACTNTFDTIGDKYLELGQR